MKAYDDFKTGERRRSELDELNRQVDFLKSVLLRHPGLLKVSELGDEDRHAYLDVEELVDYFLWKVCLSETDNVELAASAVAVTRIDFFKSIKAQTSRPRFLEWVFEACVAMLIPPNVWLFLRVKRHLRELGDDAASSMISRGSYHPSAPPEIVIPDFEILRILAEKHCPLGCYRLRKAKTDDGSAVASRGSRFAGRCRRVCSTLLLVAMGFKPKQIGLALGIDKNQPTDLTRKCLTMWEALKGGQPKAPVKPRERTA